jgi:DNA-binding PadR family transcriptional regulator
MKIFVKGLLRLFILCEAEKPVSGKMITERIADLTAEKWRPSPGAIYPLLRKMEREGLLKSELSEDAGRREITYSITTHGKKHLAEGRGRIMHKGDVGTTFLPLITKIIHNFDDIEIKELCEQFERFAKLREKLLSLPEKKRKEAFMKICKSFEKLVQS